MRLSLSIFLLSSLAVAFPAPQLIDLAKIEKSPDPVFVAAPLDVQSDIPTTVSAAPTASATSVSRRGLSLLKRDGDCAPQPSGSGPVSTPDTAEAFASDPQYPVSIAIPYRCRRTH